MTTVNNLLITVDTTVPMLSIGQIQLSADRRSTDTAKLTAAQRIRRAVLPAGYWGELVSTLDGERNQQLANILRSALIGIGNERLKAILTFSPMQSTVPLADFTVAALLSWSEEDASIFCAN